MSLLVVGSIALDSVQTPTETRNDVLGGSASYFSYAASYFTSVSLVGVVGDDFPTQHIQLLQSRKIDTQGLEILPGKKTFRWTGKYHDNMNDRDTLDVQLNVLGEFRPKLPDSYKRCAFVFLANGAPQTQIAVLEQMVGTHLAVADTMDLWIQTEREALEDLLRRVDGLVLNDSEARLFTEDENLIRAGRTMLEHGPKFIVIKKGEHGSMFISRHEIYVLPAFPTADVVDPTGAGDSFAGGMMGYLASQGHFEPETLKRAMAYGTVVASFNVEDFSLDRMQKIERPDLEDRIQQYRKMFDF